MDCEMARQNAYIGLVHLMQLAIHVEGHAR